MSTQPENIHRFDPAKSNIHQFSLQPITPIHNHQSKFYVENMDLEKDNALPQPWSAEGVSTLQYNNVRRSTPSRARPLKTNQTVTRLLASPQITSAYRNQKVSQRRHIITHALGSTFNFNLKDSLRKQLALTAA